ncbi:unnamed protein product [Ilex paraguariensis]|uniref:VQ domain-containing protein n=1 Tax=Ilex paraguariensis TaxID=185542 RepID=A0ABC8QQ83_9AQUA
MEIPPTTHQMKSKNKDKRKRESVKVVYISSPMKVKTCASKFRATVQELTGRNSDVSRIMESHSHEAVSDQTASNSMIDHLSSIRGSLDSHRESPTSSDSFLGPFDDVFRPHQMDEKFSGMFPMSSFFESPQLDVLGSYGAM